MKKPEDKCLLVAIPMDMYRIQTNKFKSGLNFFQNAVLKLKYLPHISNQRIAELLNLDEYLVNRIEGELVSDGLLSESGVVTTEGDKVMNDSESFIIDDKNRQVGYVFSYNNGKDYFPYYQREIQYANIDETGMTFSVDNETKYIDEQPLNLNETETYEATAPREETVLNMIRNTYHHYLEASDSDEDLSRNLLKIDFLPNKQAEKVMVCTYVYLPKVENESYYNDDWRVLDPFGNGDSYELKLFLEDEKVKNKDFSITLHSTFVDVITENNRKFDEAEKWLNEQVAERLAELFDAKAFLKLDSNVQKSMCSVVKSYLRMERKHFTHITEEFVQPFFINLQSAVETILLQDQNEREEVYDDLDNNCGYGSSKEDRQRCLKSVYKKRLLSDTTLVPKVLYGVKTNSWTGKSLLDYLMKFIMSLAFEPYLEDCKVICVFKNRIETILDIAQSRNQMGHGSTVSDESVVSFDADDIQQKFQFIVELIRDYIETTK